MASGSNSECATNVKFKHFDVVPEASDHYYRDSKLSYFSNADNSVYRKIMKEWRSLEKDLPESIYVQVYETRINLLRAVIIGAEGTPYHNGLFFFDICLPYDYPRQPPKVYYHAHGIRLNPNLYPNGKVCLSLLNTWSGSKKEMWTQNSTILQVLVSIQGLILNERPLFNEPFSVESNNTKNPVWIKQFVAYNEKVFILSCKTMIYTMRNPPKNFEIFVVEYFSKNANSILASVIAQQDQHLLVGLCSIKASSSFKSELKKMHSKLKKVFDIISEPNIKNSEKFEKIRASLPGRSTILASIIRLIQSSSTRFWSFSVSQPVSDNKSFTWSFSFDFSGKCNNEALKEELEEKRRAQVVAKLHAILRPFLLRRMKSDVEQMLPRKKEIIIYATLTAYQKNFQDHLINRTLENHLRETVDTGRGMKGKLNNLMIQLRKNCNHPDLLESAFDGSYFYPPVEQIVGQCGKFQLLDRLLAKLFERKHKVLIFSQWTKILDIMEYYFSEKGFEVCRIDGNVKLAERKRQVIAISLFHMEHLSIFCCCNLLGFVLQ
ncbi:unnamed protein product [Fraxinus pennsylvanica]|uniref:UBC core domain-containing protein n=1 Tax=Fraxinus pennsylvanica TaxID=56036 RepID=A0AAD1ZV61_9LAMI|nr:unnamed protein product [Fraxinus pennsylvanica]